MPDVVMLSGSPVAPSRSQHLLCIAEKILARRGYSARCIEIRQLPAAALVRCDWKDPVVRAALEMISEARAVVVATPLYNASYSGMLKMFLDLLPRTAFSDKPVLPVATGGSLAHLLALDYALKPVLAALGARIVLDNVFATERDLPKAGDGYTVTGALELRLSGAVQSLVQTLDDAAMLARLRASACLASEYTVSS